MTARILIVDNVPANVKLLQAKLAAEYFEVEIASSGEQALEICRGGKCDLVLLDVIMPGMDGFEVCRQLKKDPATMHLPVVMITALDTPSDRVAGLEAGADDFLTKPVKDLALTARVRSLARLKMLTDELGARAATARELGIEDLEIEDSPSGKILLVDDRPSSRDGIFGRLSRHHEPVVEDSPQEALFNAAENQFDLALVSPDLTGHDGLRLCSQLRSLDRTRTLPILAIDSPESEPRGRSI